MSKILKINHIAIAVNNLDDAMPFWRDVLGIPMDHIEDVPSQKSKVAFFPIGDSEIELIMPTGPGTGLAEYLRKHGEGMHHICFEVDDIESSLEMLKEKEIRLIDNEARVLPGRKIAFIHPKSTGGVLVELYELILEG
ncbi:MAG: methylmalonyl-CoA epimerase [Anaerolineaceae bacterium]|nr:methylmalonyl-CoA epimerase [Anaerolineaceae bacterium]